MANPSRRGFIGSLAAASSLMTTATAAANAPSKPAILGGKPACSGSWKAWPVWRQSWEPAVLKVLRSGLWNRRPNDDDGDRFEAAYAKLLGAEKCLATASGTTALITALHVMGVDAGDEVIVSPYTFIATYNAILAHKALPVFADTDPETLTIDPASIESRITDRTRALLPVHIFGMPCAMDEINAIADSHKIAVVEDACQAWLAEYKGQKCGTLADLGCFSFQNSKHISCGEGGAITSNKPQLIDRCNSYHNCGRSVGSYTGAGYFTRGGNFRMPQIQASMLLQQIDKLAEETAIRQANADYLESQLRDIAGIGPARLPADSRAVWHLYPMRYDSSQFNGLARDRFISALRAERVPCSSVYHEQYFDGLLDEAIASPGYRRLFSKKRLKEYRESFHELKGNKQVCETTVAIPQKVLLGTRPQMDQIAEAIRRIQHHSKAIARLEQ